MISSRPLLLLFLLSIAAPGAMGNPPLPAPYPEHDLTIRIVDGAGIPISARIHVFDPPTGFAFRPADRPFYEAYTGHNYFYAHGSVRLGVHNGPVRILASRGPEFEAYDAVHDVTQDEVVTIVLESLFSPASLGWYGGDTHVHMAHGGVGAVFTITPEDVALAATAEDLDVTCVLSDGLHFGNDFSTGSGGNRIVHFGVEYRSAVYGHVALVGLPSLPPGLGCCLPGEPAYPLNRTVIDDAHAAGAYAVASHPITFDPDSMTTSGLAWPFSGFGREFPLDALFGVLDGFDIFSYSNYQNSTQLISPSQRLWFDLLNLGLALPASAGTDASLNREFDPPPGGFRVYAQLDTTLTVHTWMEAIASGRSFATNGPLPYRFAANGASPGDTISFAGNEPHDVVFDLDLFSRDPVSLVEIYFNGDRWAFSFLPLGDRWIHKTFQANLPQAAGWIVARISGPAGHPTSMGAYQEAFTSPIYVDDPAHEVLPSASSVSRFTTWFDDLEAVVIAHDSWQDPSQEEEVLAAIDCARALIQGGDCAASKPRVAPAARLTLAPVRAGARFAAALAGPGPARVEVFDVLGRRVHVSSPLDLPAEFVWPLPGRRPPGGVYFVRARSSNAVSSASRVVVLP